MTIPYTLTFVLLVVEIVTFCAIILPLPHSARRKIFTFLSENYIVAKIVYGLKITFIFIGVLFVDSLARMFRIDAELRAAKSNVIPGSFDVRTETNIAARRFYAQRNVYLTGFTLFLSLVLTRTFAIVLDLIRIQDEYAKFKKSVEGYKKSTDNVKELEQKLAVAEAHARDFDVLKKQSEAQAKEYDRLATDFNKATGSISDKRRD